MTEKRDSSRPSELLEATGIKTHFPIRKGILRRTVGHVKAVDGVDLSVKRGETLGLVGESGCGKTTLGRTLIRLVPATEGRVVLHQEDGTVDLFALEKEELRRMRKRFQYIFQDPFSSLNPRMSVFDIVAEPLVIHGEAKGKDLEERVAELLSRVGLGTRLMRRYPHAFSGGQRQRIGIARALALRPQLVIADEPVSALDVSVQAQVLNLMEDLQDEFGLTYLFVAHDLSVVEHISDRVAVMYLGRIVELAPADLLYEAPLHPYTRSLLDAVPKPDPGIPLPENLLEGDVPDPSNAPAGCAFHPRCPFSAPVCISDVPSWHDIAPGRFARCHFAGQLDL